jgi:hypothetical protein
MIRTSSRPRRLRALLVAAALSASMFATALPAAAATPPAGLANAVTNAAPIEAGWVAPAGWIWTRDADGFEADGWIWTRADDGISPNGWIWTRSTDGFGPDGWIWTRSGDGEFTTQGWIWTAS